MKRFLKGRAHIFGDNIDTDQIYPGRYLELTEAGDIRQHAMEGADPRFVQVFKPGDIIVAGKNFGCGPSGKHAVMALKAVGTGVVVAESFARNFYRSAINIGLPLLVCPGIRPRISARDRLSIDLVTGVIENINRRAVLKAQPLSRYVMEILEAGGIQPRGK